jgi:hypothetical protein
VSDHEYRALLHGVFMFPGSLYGAGRFAGTAAGNKPAAKAVDEPKCSFTAFLHLKPIRSDGYEKLGVDKEFCKSIRIHMEWRKGQ